MFQFTDFLCVYVLHSRLVHTQTSNVVLQVTTNGTIRLKEHVKNCDGIELYNKIITADITFTPQIA